MAKRGPALKKDAVVYKIHNIKAVWDKIV